MAQNDLRAVAFPKLDETQIAALGRRAEASLKQYRTGEKLFEVAGDVRSGSVKRVASAVGRRSNGGRLRARVLEGHVNDAQSPTWPPRENHPDAAYHKCRDVSAKDFRIDLGAQSIGVEIMKCNIEFKGFAPQKESQKQITDLVTKIEKKTKAFPLDVVFLRLMIEENPARKLYHVSLVLEIPGKSPGTKKTLATKEDRHDLHETLRDAFAEIARQLEAYKSTLRGEHLWKQRARRDKLRQMKAVVVPVEQGYRELFFPLASRQLKGLYQFVRHQLAYFESVGDLIPGELTPEEVVDAVLLRAYREFVKDPAERDIGSWLTVLATKQLESEVKRLTSEREGTVHIEEDIPETPPTEEVSTLGEEILDFHQPDEDLKLEDVIPDLKIPTPEQIAETKELRRCVNAALAGLPREWRQALWLRHGEGVTGTKLAKAIGRAEPEIERILEYTLQYLRQRLVELGCQFKESDSRPVPVAAEANSERQAAKHSASS